MKTLGLGLVRCVDALVWDLDTSAKMSAVFVNPYLRYGIGVPLVDWPATNDDECRLVVQAARAVIAARKTEYADLLEDEDVDNLPATAEVPAIHIRVDETKSMADDVLQGIDFIIEEGRSVNVRVDTTGLRATRDYITAAMDELTPGRIGLRTNNSSELDMLFPGFGAPDMAIFTDPGTVVYMSATKGPFQPTREGLRNDGRGVPRGQRRPQAHVDAVHGRGPPALQYPPRPRRGIRPRRRPRLRTALGPLHPQPARRRPRQRRPRPHARIRVGAVPVLAEARLLRRTPRPRHRRRRQHVAPHPPTVTANIPRLSEDLLDDDELERAAAQEAAIELAKASPKPKSDDELAVELFRAQGRPKAQSEVYPLMVKAGYTCPTAPSATCAQNSALRTS
jgi:hypothetical protein